MRGVISTWRRWTNRPVASPALPPAADAPVQLHADRDVVRRLCRTLDRAMALGLLEHAQRVAATAARFSGSHPRLTERLARLRLVLNDPRGAIEIIERQPAERTSSLQLLYAACLLRTDRRAEAHLLLHRLASKTSAPLGARLMLGIVEFQTGNVDAAINALLRNLRQIDDPRTLLALTLVSSAAARTDMSARWARRLEGCVYSGPSAIDQRRMFLILRSLGLASSPLGCNVAPARLSGLADELVEFEEVISALVAWQRIILDQSDVRLLRDAIKAAMPRLLDQAAAHEAINELEFLLHLEVHEQHGPFAVSPQRIHAGNSVGTQEPAGKVEQAELAVSEAST